MTVRTAWMLLIELHYRRRASAPSRHINEPTHDLVWTLLVRCLLLTASLSLHGWSEAEDAGMGKGREVGVVESLRTPLIR